jgi:hypothetical protein
VGDHFHVVPEVVGHHHDLKNVEFVFKFCQRDHIQAFALGFADYIFDVSHYVVFGDDVMGRACQVGAKYSISVSVFFKNHILLRLVRGPFQFF